MAEGVFTHNSDGGQRVDDHPDEALDEAYLRWSTLLLLLLLGLGSVLLIPLLQKTLSFGRAGRLEIQLEPGPAALVLKLDRGVDGRGDGVLRRLSFPRA